MLINIKMRRHYGVVLLVVTKYCPYKYKYELVNWLVSCKGWTISQANALKKAQLYAIWYKS